MSITKSKPVLLFSFYENIRYYGIHKSTRTSHPRCYHFISGSRAYIQISWAETQNPFGMEVLDINQYIPPLYWTSKQHQCQYKIRFIAGASKCHNKQLPTKLSLALKCVKHHSKTYLKVIEKRTGILNYWSVDYSYKLYGRMGQIMQ